MVKNANFPFIQVYDRVKGGDEYQKKLDVLPTRVAECEEAIRQEQGQVEAKQADKAEQVQLCKTELPPLPVMLMTGNRPACNAYATTHISAPCCEPKLQDIIAVFQSVECSPAKMHFACSEDAGLY